MTTTSLEEARGKATLFVRGIPYEATDQDLKDYFGQVGPVKACFVVKEKQAKEEVSKDVDDESADEEAIRAMKQDKDKPTATNATHKGYGFVHFALPEDAQRALEQANETLFQGKHLLCELALKKKHIKEGTVEKPKIKKQPKKITPDLARKASQKAVASLKQKVTLPCQIKVQGLNASINKKQLYKKVRKFGSVEELVYEEKDFALVTFASHEEAKYAVAKLDQHQFKGLSLTASLELNSATNSNTDSTEKDLDLSKAVQNRHRFILRNLAFTVTSALLQERASTFGETLEARVITKQKEGQEISRGFGFVEFKEREAAEKFLEALNGQDWMGRVVAVDWSVSKNIYKKAVAEELKENEKLMKDVKEKNEKGVEKEQDEDSENEEMDEDKDESEEADSDSIENDSQSDSESDDEFNQTVFIRNLSYDATEQELIHLFSQFGNVHYARLVQDESGKPRGTAFVKFVHSKAARACIAAAEEAFVHGPVATSSHRTVDGKAFVSRLVADESVGISLHGRALQIVAALPKEEAETVGASRQKEREARDTRHLYLLREGVILPENEAGMSDVDRERRAASERDRRLKLKDLNFAVSLTRLSVRNVPLSMSDADLKKLILEAVQERLEKEEEKVGKIVIKQCKIARQMDRLDKNGQPRSRGYAFVEFSHHQHALMALRQLNNNPRVFSDTRRPIVEFAVENMRIVERRQQKQIKPVKDEEKKEKMSRGARQRLRKRERKQGEEEVVKVEDKVKENEKKKGKEIKAKMEKEKSLPMKRKAEPEKSTTPKRVKKQNREEQEADQFDALLDQFKAKQQRA